MRIAHALATLTALALGLAGCAPSPAGSPDDPEPAETSAAATETAAEPTAEATVEEVEESEAPEESEPEETASTPSEEPSEEDGESGDPEDVDLQAGLRTNDFVRLPKQLGDMARTSLNTDPSKYQAILEYMAGDEQSRGVVIVHIPFVDGEPSPVFDAGDPGYVQAVESAAEALKGDGKDFRERTVLAGGLEWTCMEVTEAQGGKFDHGLCATHAHGRMVELQRIAFPDGDPAARDAHTDTLLEDLAEGVLALGN